MTVKDLAALRYLWQEAFDEPEDFTDLFFSVGFSPDRYHCVWDNGVPVSALYWFDCYLGEQKLAYIYGVATRKTHQGKGFAGKLLQEAHNILRAQGYAGTILVPASQSLFDFYQKFGYHTATFTTKRTCDAADIPVAIRKISPEEYVRLRPAFLPEGSVMPGGDVVAFLQGYCDFYAGADFLLVCSHSPEGLRGQELLGNAQAAPGILRALNCAEGSFRTPGEGREFAMWLPLQASCPKPAWFALALD